MTTTVTQSSLFSFISMVFQLIERRGRPILIRKVLLVQPPYTIHEANAKDCSPPLGLAYLAAALEAIDIEVRILDAVVEGFEKEVNLGEGLTRYGLDFKEVEAYIADFEPDLVGISCLFSAQFVNALEVAKIAKALSGDCIVVMGGAHPSVKCRDVMNDDHIDFVVLGEGDHSFPNLIKALNTDNDYSGIDGLAYRQGEAVLVNPKTAYIENLDELPFPARHLLSMEKYFNIKRPPGTFRFSRHTPLITSRGCPARCIFCSIHSVWGRRFRSRSPENVLSEIRRLKKEYGVKELHFWDDNLTFKKDRAKSIFRMMVEDRLDVIWTTPNGIAAYAIDDELVDIMKESGCYRVYLAVESGDENVLHQIIKKPLKLQKVKPLAKKFRDVGIAADAFFVVGFPGETKEQIRKTFKFATSAGFSNANFYIANPYVGTDLYDICEKNGYLAPTFAYDRLNISNANISTPDFSAAELEKLVTSEILKYRLRQWRNPVIFYDRVVKRILTDPWYVINYVKRMIGRMVKTAA